MLNFHASKHLPTLKIKNRMFEPNHYRSSTEMETKFLGSPMSDACRWLAVMYLVAVIFLITLFMQGQMLTDNSAEVAASLEMIGHSSNSAAMFGNMQLSSNTAFTLFIGITLLFGAGFTMLRNRVEEY